MWLLITIFKEKTKSDSHNTGWPRSYRKYILQIKQPSQHRYAKLQYRFAVTSGSPSTCVVTRQINSNISPLESCIASPEWWRANLSRIFDFRLQGDVFICVNIMYTVSPRCLSHSIKIYKTFLICAYFTVCPIIYFIWLLLV